MYEATFNELKPVIEAGTKRTHSLIDAAVGTFDIDWLTGQGKVPNDDAVLTAFQSVAGGPINSDDLARSFLATLRDGFAVGRERVDPTDPKFRPVPWRSLFHAPSLAAMTLNDWNWLGIQQDSNAQAISASIRNFSRFPDYMLEKAHLESLAASAAYYIPLLQPQQQKALPRAPSKFALRRVWDDTVPLGTVGQALGGAGGASPPPPPGPDYNQIANTLMSFIKDIADCFQTAEWSIQWAAFYPLGVRICLDAACAQKVANALKSLLGTSAGGIITTIFTLIAKGTLTLAAVMGAIGWVGLAMLHFAAYWAIMILENVTPRGVCIVHLFPWNSALSGGLFNGWAEGR